MSQSKKIFKKNLISFLLLAFFLLAIFSFAKAQNVQELQKKISERTQAIKELEQEIKQYQEDLVSIGKEADSLENAIKSLDLTKKKLVADTKVTENKIASKNLEIKELSLEIGDKSERISGGKKVISSSLYNISQISKASIIETILGQESLSDVWNVADQLSSLQGSMQYRIKELKNLKTDLEVNKIASEKKKAELVELTNELKDQTKIVEATTKEKDALLKETKNTEASYAQLLAQRKAEKEKFEKELFDIESKLKFILNPNSIPSAGTTVFNWPLDSVFVTQYFGNTEFALSGAYNGNGHNGIDFRAPVGTRVKSALNGTVIAINNKVAPYCQYGKWVLVQHPNGLTTLYAHLSLISVNKGDPVSTGQALGYSGDTGYAFGAHLHFTVYASAAVELDNYTCKSGAVLSIPTAAFSAYLNPIDYLPRR